MEESRQRDTYPKIIDDSRLKTKKRVFLETSITLGFWGIIGYFFATLITFILWLFGLQLFYYEIYVMGFPEMVRLFQNALRITVIVVLALFAWSYYNIILIKIKGERRKSQARICFDKDMAEFFHIDLDVLERVKNNSRLTILLENNAVKFIQSSPLSAPNN